jgi:hypothetical protein
VWTYISTPTYTLMAWCLIRHKDYFIFIFNVFVIQLSGNIEHFFTTFPDSSIFRQDTKIQSLPPYARCTCSGWYEANEEMSLMQHSITTKRKNIVYLKVKTV